MYIYIYIMYVNQLLSRTLCFRRKNQYSSHERRVEK
jgi:hypothetical protein